MSELTTTINHSYGPVSPANSSLQAALGAPSLTEQVVLATTLTGLIVVSILGNSLVVAAVYCDSRLHAFTNYFIVSLACADLLISVLVMPLALVYEVLGYWPFGWWVCLGFTTLDILCCTSSILNLCAISLDRYWAIVTPFKYPVRMTRRTCPMMIGVVWVMSTVTSVAQIGWRAAIDQLYSADTDSCAISSDPFFRVFSSTSSFYGPTVLMLFVNIKVLVVARKQQSAIRVQQKIFNTMNSNGAGTEDDNQTNENTLANSSPRIGSRHASLARFHQSSTNESSQPDLLSPTSGSLRTPKMSVVRRISMAVPASFRKASRSLKQQASELKAFKTLSIVMGTFIINWSPFFIVYLLEGFCSTCHFSRWLLFVCLWLGYLNSSLNPFIYVFFNKQYRTAFIRVLRLKRRRNDQLFHSSSRA